ncbi:hypothetical protein OVA24_07015 [Luteolibacter sp. SL250]|uniref:hypothetical protein n=1 Tax=Luteolibacter sp. SL250 TaxID=2995170 RepID=UPI00226DFB51|nr:hypothetical protein [Luteolibacter sp. SL250]WAC21133.1 hypothetical protein OVA24_07015 [Luteolibacter sp. SL250]
MKALFRGVSLPVFLMLVASGTAQAVIVGGTLGTGTNNGSESSLQSYLSSSSQASFNHWGNLLRVNDASGVYLGYNQSTGNGWVLGAGHVGNPGTITVAGTSYAVVHSQTVTGTDLLLMEISGVAGTAAAALPTVNLASTSATTNEFVLMMGRGYTTATGTSDPYPWGSTSASDAQVMRWGTNRVTSVQNAVVSGVTSMNIITDFDPPGPTGGPGAVTAYEGQVAIGDSGGGMFAYRGGQWVLVGIGHFADDEGGSAADSAEYGDRSGYTDVFTYRTDITAITGTLIPEPSAALLLPLAGALVCRRRRR